MFTSLVFCLLVKTCVPPPTPIRVVGVGDTSEQARDNAYREAIETYIGSVVVSDKDMRDSQLVKDSILVYSSAYVERMRVISDTPQGTSRRVELDVWLSGSQIANRILTVVGKDQDLDSALIGEQFRTYAKSKSQGDRLLTNVMELYPYNAFVTETKQTEFRVDQYRTPYLRVAYSVKWNKNYFVALEETVKVISDGTAAKTNPAATMVFGGGSSWFLKPYYFNDVIPVSIMYDKFDRKKLAVRLTVSNGSQTVFTTCQGVSPNYFHGPGHSNLDVAGNKVYNGEFNIKFPARIDPNLRTTITVDSEDRCSA